VSEGRRRCRRPSSSSFTPRGLVPFAAKPVAGSRAGLRTGPSCAGDVVPRHAPDDRSEALVRCLIGWLVQRLSLCLPRALYIIRGTTPMLFRVRRAESCRTRGVLAPLSVRSVVGAVLAHGSAFRRHRSIRPGEGVESSVARDGRHRVRSAWSRKANEVGTGGRRGCGPRTHGVLPRRTRVTEYPPVVHRVCGQAPSSVDDAVTRMWTDGVMGDRSHRVVGHVERLVAVWHPA
jgi:hypothetical protein